MSLFARASLIGRVDLNGRPQWPRWQDVDMSQPSVEQVQAQIIRIERLLSLIERAPSVVESALESADADDFFGRVAELLDVPRDDARGVVDIAQLRLFTRQGRAQLHEELARLRLQL